MRRLIITSALGFTMAVQGQAPLCDQPNHEPGAPNRASADQPDVQQAIKVVHKYFSFLRIKHVDNASIQLVEGLLVTLRCRVSGEDDSGLWEFAVIKRLDNHWRLLSAVKIKD